VRLWVGPWQGRGTLIRVPIDPQALVGRPGHHAGPSEKRVVDGIGRDVGIMVLELNVNHDEIVDMFQVVPDLIGCELSRSTVDDKVSAGPASDFV
jgi:hypothetical protein